MIVGAMPLLTAYLGGPPGPGMNVFFILIAPGYLCSAVLTGDPRNPNGFLLITFNLLI